MTNNLLKDIVRYVPSRIIPALAGFIFYPIATRLFEPADFSQYALIVAAVGLLTIFGTWTSSSIIRFFPAYDKSGAGDNFTFTILKLSFISILTIAVLALLAVLLARRYIPPGHLQLLIAGICYFLLDAFFLVFSSFLRIKRRLHWYSGFVAWKSITALIFGFILVVMADFGVEGLVWGYALSVGIILPILWIKAVGLKQKQWGQADTIPTSTLTKYSFPLVAAGIAAWVLSLSDRYMIGLLRSADEVGIYSVGYDIADKSIMFLVMLFAQAFTPLAVIAWENKGQEESGKFMLQGTRHFLLLGIPAVVGISVLREPILHLLSTPSYYAAAGIVPYVALGGLLLGISQRFYTILGISKKTHLIMYGMILAAVLNIVLNLFLVPSYGYKAAAITTLISYGLLLIFNVWASVRLFAWKFPLRSTMRALGAATIMGFLVHYTSNVIISTEWVGIVVGIPIGVVSYAMILIMLREFQSEEMAKLRKFLPVSGK
jgi:O-antigen/teichoic acid export membrane protein